MKKLLILLLIFINIHRSFFIFCQQKINLNDLYLKAEFSKILNHLQNKQYGQLSLEENLLLIECYARLGKGHKIINKITQILSTNQRDIETLTVAAIVCFSVGQMKKTQQYLTRVLAINNNYQKAILAKIMLLLYLQHYEEAANLFEKKIINMRHWIESFLNYHTGLEVYTANRNSVKLADLYQKRSRWLRKINDQQHKNLKANARLFRKIGKVKLFNAETAVDKIMIPFSKSSGKTSENTINLKIKNKEIKILLDTGNLVGCMIHDFDLMETLSTNTGGNTVILLGTIDERLDGKHIFIKAFEFENFKIHNLSGIYVTKPYPEFYDVNINPIFIRNRITTFDYLRGYFILRTENRFRQDINIENNKNITILPWYGHEQIYIPVILNNQKKGVGMIETGADDISIKLGLAKAIPLKLIPRVKYLSSGKIYQYHQTSIKLSLGDRHFIRPNAEVWSFKRLYHRITGFEPDVIIGPKAFKGRYAISFDPFNKRIILEYSN